MTSSLIHYSRWLVADYYQSAWAETLAIYLSGAPSMPSDKSHYVEILASAKIDLVVPDYYGYGRSAGFFDVKWCVQTAYDTVQVFRDSVPLVDVYGDHEILPPLYKEIVVVGSSYGGRVAAWLPKFDESVQEVVLLAPLLEDLGEGEESDEEFLRQYLLGYKGMYRLNPDYEPLDAMLGFDQLFTREDLGHLEGVKVFVGHGSADSIIHPKRSERFVQDLQRQFPHGTYQYAWYYGLGHGGLMSRAGLSGWLYWRELNNEQWGISN